MNKHFNTRMPFVIAPTLSFSDEFGRWLLRFNDELDGIEHLERSYYMVIDHSWDGECWYRYRFIAYFDGEWIELMTRKQYNAHVADIEENEGDEIARIWEVGQNQYEVVPDHHPVFRLRWHFEALVTLRLFDLTITHREWKSKPLSSEVLAQMNAVKEQDVRDMIAAEIEAERKEVAVQ